MNDDRMRDVQNQRAHRMAVWMAEHPEDKASPAEIWKAVRFLVLALLLGVFLIVLAGLAINA